jgi:hypothetical protein
MPHREKTRAVAVAVVMFVLSVVATGCLDDEHDHGVPKAADFRCRVARTDGDCDSMPANCPVTLGLDPSRPPACPLGAELIPVEDDHCTHKSICID